MDRREESGRAEESASDRRRAISSSTTTRATRKSIVGIAKATSNAYPDPADKTGKAHVVDLVPVKKLKRPVTLNEIKADARFKDFPLTYMPRLSVMPVTEEQWKMILDKSERNVGRAGLWSAASRLRGSTSATLEPEPRYV